MISEFTKRGWGASKNRQWKFHNTGACRSDRGQRRNRANATPLYFESLLIYNGDRCIYGTPTRKREQLVLRVTITRVRRNSAAVVARSQMLPLFLHLSPLYNNISSSLESYRSKILSSCKEFYKLRGIVWYTTSRRFLFGNTNSRSYWRVSVVGPDVIGTC